MKAYFLPLGAGADQSLPAMLSAVGCGAARDIPAVSVLRIASAAPSPLSDAMAADLNACQRFFAGKDAFAFFRTAWTLSTWQPALPGRDALAPNENSRLLLSALRGQGPLAYAADPEAVSWGLATLLEGLEAPRDDSPAPGDSAGLSDPLQPFRHLLAGLRSDLAGGEDVRLVLYCHLTEPYAAGLALGLLRFFRTCFPDRAPFIGLIAAACPQGTGAEKQRARVRDVLTVLRDRNLIRPAEGRDTLGGDACWLLGLPSALAKEEGGSRLLDWEAARILGDIFGSPRVPTPGLHTRELPGTLTLQSLDEQAKPFAAFLRGSCWCLCDLFPALRSFFEHPARLRSLAPATRGGLFRRLFRERGLPEELALLERTLRALLLQILSLLRSLPAPLRDAEADSALWREAVKACGRAVTRGAEYDVSMKEAEDSGVDKVAPVHRVSMSDTEEEQLMRKLDAMAQEVEQLLSDRQAVFDQIGGFRARQALEDCLSRCQVAEVSAREKLSVMPSAEPEERYALGVQERRVRLLSAAVRRCEKDLEALCSPASLEKPAARAVSAPFAGEILDPSLAEQAFLMLTMEGEKADAAAKALREGLGGLLKHYPLNDVKMLLKNLLSVCRMPDSDAPLRSLMAGVFSVCGVEVSGLRFQSAGELPALPLLPDMRAEGRFFTLSAAPDLILAPAAQDETAQKRGLLGFLLLREYRRRSGEDAALCFHPLRGEDGPLCRAYLAARGVKEVTLACLGREDWDRELPLSVLLPGTGLEPARLSGAQADAFPSFLVWLDRETLRFGDPCAFLSEGDRRMLTQQLTRLRAALNASGNRAFADFLSAWHTDIIQAPKAAEEDDLLPIRLRVACGLFRLPVWKTDLKRVSAFFESDLPGDPVCAALSGQQDFLPPVCQIREEITYTFRGTPIARENASCLLESPHVPEERHFLSSLGEECAILLRSSDDYHDALAAGIRELLDRFPSADPVAREAAEAVLREAEAPIADAVTELTWPWDTVSASVLTVLSECLGADLAAAALRPFSDLLVLFPARGGEIIGDHLLSACCQIQRNQPGKADVPVSSREAGAAAERPASVSTGEEGIPAGGFGQAVPASFPSQVQEAPGNDAPPEIASVPTDAVLPPLSPDFASAICRLPKGQSLIHSRFLSFEAEGTGIQVTLTLEGAFTLKLTRLYSSDEQVPLYSHDLPSLAVWPSMPFPPDRWRAYFSWAHSDGDFRFSVLTQEEERELEGPAPRFALMTERYPLCFLLSRGGRTAGALPNLLPVPERSEGSVWTASMDFGTAATSLVLSDGKACFPLQGPVRMRTLLRSPAAVEDLLWKEFLPGVPITALLPGALRIFRHDPADGDLPFRDAVIYMSSSLGDVLDVTPGALYSDLKWNGERDGRAVRLYLHQVMLMAALEARCGGAAGLCWKAAVPDEMGAEGRERLARILRSLAEDVSRESGLPLPEKRPAVAFASESTALGTYFRFCDPEETRGGFMTLDLGADTADLALFLQGRDQAERACQLPLGVHYMLLPALLARPAVLTEDFGFLPEEPLRRDLARLQSLLEQASRDPAALRQARCGLDALIADHFPLLLQAMTVRREEGAPCLTGALLLLYFSFLMMLSGLNLLQISAESQRNDFLPDSMTLFLSGRGAALMEALSLPSKTSLWKMLTMFRNPRVSALRLLFSAEKKMEIPVGLDLMRDASAGLPKPPRVPAAMALRPEELMPEFLVRFRREFPAEAALLFPGVYAAEGMDPFTPFGRQLLSQAIQAALGDRETGRPYPALITCLTHLMEMLREGVLL